jgi:hypothetical protein
MEELTYSTVSKQKVRAFFDIHTWSDTLLLIVWFKPHKEGKESISLGTLRSTWRVPSGSESLLQELKVSFSDVASTSGVDSSVVSSVRLKMTILLSTLLQVKASTLDDLAHSLSENCRAIISYRSWRSEVVLQTKSETTSGTLGQPQGVEFLP